jgi:hypothetical protein
MCPGEGGEERPGGRMVLGLYPSKEETVAVLAVKKWIHEWFISWD